MMTAGNTGFIRDYQPVRLAGGWWLVLVCSKRRVLLAGSGWWLVAGLFREKSTVGWWLISQAKRAYFHKVQGTEKTD
jgi:hypothetical protein